MHGLLIVNDQIITIKDHYTIVNHGGIAYIAREPTKEILYLVYPNPTVCTHELKTNDHMYEKLITLLKLWNTKSKLKLAEAGCEKELIELWEKDYAGYSFKTLMLGYLENNDYNAMQIELLRNTTYMKINKLISKLKNDHKKVKCEQCNPISEFKLNAFQAFSAHGATFLWIPLIK